MKKISCKGQYEPSQFGFRELILLDFGSTDDCVLVNGEKRKSIISFYLEVTTKNQDQYHDALLFGHAICNHSLVGSMLMH